jgi:hypothetical protein
MPLEVAGLIDQNKIIGLVLYLSYVGVVVKWLLNLGSEDTGRAKMEVH